MTALPSASVLVRTWFGNDSAWESLVQEVRTPSEQGFLAHITLVDDPAFTGMSAEELAAQQTSGAIVSFLADETTLTDSEHPILAVPVFRHDDERPFRVVPATLWAVENNINIGNRDWTEYTNSLDEDGIYR